MSQKLYHKLIEYKDEKYYPFHMPGHKRNINKMEKIAGEVSPYQYDITEIEGFDDLHNPSEIIAEMMEEASKFYGSGSSYFLVNGSTCGILAAVSAVMAGDNSPRRIVLARNSHKSAYNAVMLQNADIKYVYPSIIGKYDIQGGVNPKDIEDILSTDKDVSAVFITSPTYEGIVSDIKEIAHIAHKYEVPLIVDEAHGAHFSMHKDFPESALLLGADIVIQSLHKTLPSLTQTAILHISKTSLVNKEEIQRYLSIYQSSSPSYVLMASIDICINEIMNEGDKIFSEWKSKLKKFHDRCKRFSNIEILDKEIVGNYSVKDFDISKLVIISKNKSYTGFDLYKKLLYDYKIQLEMATPYYAIAMTSIMDEDEGFERLYKALEEIDKEINLYNNKVYEELIEIDKAIVCMKIKDAIYSEKKNLLLEDAIGRISSEFIYLYPPGIPIVAPGESITKEIIDTIISYKNLGLNVVGLKDKKCDRIDVVKI